MNKIFRFARFSPLLLFVSFGWSSAALAAGPVVGGVMPTTATAGSPVTLSASVSSGAGIKYCHLYVDLEDVGDMTVAYGSASKEFTFPSGGSRIAFVFCKDNSDGLGAGPNTAIWVNGSIQSQPPLGGGGSNTTTSNPPPQTPTSTTPGDGSLVKLACAEGALADDPCKAVYYIAKDGKRHAFPNSKVYFSWYSDFNAVQTVTSDVMGGFTLGQNVTYRPGSKMVKFATLNNVYVVSKGSTLQWVTTETVAIALYGSDWNTKVDDIPDTFYGNYKFGADISDSTAYSVTSQMSAAPTIDDSL